MPSSVVCTFANPDEHFAAVRSADVEGVVTGRGQYRAELTCIAFVRLLLQRGDDSLARVVNVAVSLERIGIHFATDPNQSATYFSGLELSQSEVVAGGLGSEHHLRSTAASRWGDLSLTPEDLSAAGYAILGRELKLPEFGRPISPPAPVLSRLRNLHEAAGRLAKAAPHIFANPAAARAMEEPLVHALVSCLAEGEPANLRSVYRHRVAVMRRLEVALQENSDEPLYLTELCAAVGASYPTLRACCQEHLGMSPKRYLLLRRMHLARSALRRADREATTVTEVATNYGFWELGRFAVSYRSLFGESPSVTLRRSPDDPKSEEFGQSPWRFTKSA